MYALQVVSRNDLEITTSFFKTKEEAHAKMVEGVLFISHCKSVEEFLENRVSFDCPDGDGYDEWIEEDNACCDSRDFGDVHWYIIKIPEEV